jgi:hypothetical protein
LLFKVSQFARAGKGTAPSLTWSKTAVFPDFANKGFGELGSLFERSEFEQVPKACE